MISPRWRKLQRDLLATKGRVAMMVLAIAVGIFGIGTILSAYTILTREISHNYLGTNPASATLELDQVNDTLVEAVRLRPGITDAEAGNTVMARIEIKPDEWLPLMLFVVEDFTSLHMNKFQWESGSWPPAKDSLLLERTALELIDAKIGDSPRIQTPGGSKQTVAISGTVHDPGLAPAWQEQTAYGYVTPSFLEKLGESGNMQLLKVKVSSGPKPTDIKTIEQTVSDLAVWLKEQGHTVEEIRIPPPGRHPHQTQMTAILVMLLLFSLMVLVLSAILTSTMISGMLAQQVRQIGVMKAIGARSTQVSRLYLALVVTIGFVAVLIGLPPAIWAGHGFAQAVAKLLNFTLYSEAVPGWVYLVQLAAGLFVPVIIALIPITRATRITVREAIRDFGTSQKKFGSRRLDQILGKLRGFDRTLILMLRNTFRRRGRLLLALGLLAAAGGMFMTSLNVKTAWSTSLADASSHRHYDLEIRLNHAEPQEKLLQLISNLPGVQQVETWNYSPAGAYRPNGLEIVRTYPDEGHGSLTLRSVPEGSRMVDWNVLSGRWLQTQDSNAVVLNHTAHAMFPAVQVGDSLRLNVEGHPVTLTVVGIVKEMLTPGAAYVTPSTYTSVIQQAGYVNAVRVSMKHHDTETRKAVAQEIEQQLDQGKVSVKSYVSETMLDSAISGHVYILIFALIMLSVLIATVGAIGLMSTMGTNVAERTREFGIMRTIGGRSRTMLRNVISEGLFIGLMSFIIAILISLPLSSAVGRLIGKLSFFYPLPLVVSPLGIGIWFGVITLGSIAASIYPARRASQLTIRETLTMI